MTEKDQIESFSEEQQDILKSIRMSRIIIPVLLGLVVVVYLMWNQFNPDEFNKIEWTSHTLLWVVIAILIMIIRHIAYAYRLRLITDQFFSWKKSIELVFIWEFSSAVSPTSVGGSAVALFILSQEKLSTARTATLVLYSVIMDNVLFITSLPILLYLYGPSIIRPYMTTLFDSGGWGYSFVGAYIFMFLYGAFFIYGILINPKPIKSVLLWFTKFGFLKKYRTKAEKLGDDMIVASDEIRRKKWPFHFGAFFSTLIAWGCKFIVLNCLIIALVNNTPMDLASQMRLFARSETMFLIMAVTPTPGGAGFAEFVFGGFLSDFVSEGIAPIIAFLWRVLTYYLYLIAGVIVIPNWIRHLLNERKKRKKLSTN